ncbi:hypothetical protein NM688_g1599 [Phlebia brevispora]|uniref:Uncharacterized protein n=1 Tax=Phlebia brevispora TaxID=194682 RepID=A0ACC1TB85_9APHY|nr:hypothetical protein NM688_g1599 [Phlebia brevispora]
MSVTTGTVPFVVGDETYQTWYRVLGDLKSGVRPLVLLHGGPGIPHHYLLGHDELYKQHNIPIVWYDQVGCGASTHLPDKPKSFWTEEFFMDELENVVKHLGIADNYDLLGHSWGGMLTARFAATRHPAGLKRIVITNSPAALRLWEEGNAVLLKQMPQHMQDVIRKNEDAGTLEDPEYKAALHAYYLKHVCRISPWPEPFTKSLTEIAKDPTVCHTLLGPKEFEITGTLKNWDITGILGSITQPTLVINGHYDMAQDICVAPFFEKIPKVKWARLSESSHLPCWEEPERYYQILKTQFGQRRLPLESLVPSQ